MRRKKGVPRLRCRQKNPWAQASFDRGHVGIGRGFGGYRGELVDNVKRWYGRTLEIVKRSDAHKFVVLPKRWVVERTFAWLGKYRRLSKDYESDPRSSETMIRLAMINLMLHRLKPG